MLFVAMLEVYLAEYLCFRRSRTKLMEVISAFQATHHHFGKWLGYGETLLATDIVIVAYDLFSFR